MWQLEGTRVRWNSDRFRGELDLADPNNGLRILGWGSESIGNARILQLGWLAETSSDNELVTSEELASEELASEHFIRGNELIVSYAGSGAIQFQISLSVTDDPQAVDAIIIEACLSVQTDLLDVNPRVQIGSSLPGERWARVRIDRPPARVGALAPDDWESVDSDESGCALLFRFPGHSLSFGQIIQADDFINAGLVSDSAEQAPRLEAGLFPGKLEKGVLRRARIRALLMSRERDEPFLAEQLDQFSQTTPPLGA